MKGLLKRLSPFAPDQSGAAGVFFELGGILVICDAGGCTGNICGFDEPRWFTDKCAMFSAGLRDMDAVLGRDDRMVSKLKLISEKMNANFAAIIGTPVPAVIATDFRALKRMSEKRTGLKTMTVECTGTRLYDEGERDAYLTLFQSFAGKREAGSDENDAPPEKEERRIGLLGATPLNLSSAKAVERLKQYYQAQGYDRVLSYGMGDGLEAIRHADLAEKNIVLSPSAVAVAEYLKEQFGTPYEAACPILEEEWSEKLRSLVGKKVLIIHQQILANTIRDQLIAFGAEAEDITVGTWFLMNEEYKKPWDVHFTTEKGYVEYAEEGAFEGIIADPLLFRPLLNYDGEKVELIHFAVSGKYGE